MPLPRICVLCVIPEMGGAEFSLLELVARLRDSFEFHLIVPSDGQLKERAEEAGAATWILPWPATVSRTGETAVRPSSMQMLRSASGLRSFAQKLSALLDQIDPSVLITNAVKAHLAGALARGKRNAPLVWYMRNGFEDRAVSRRLLAFLAHRCDLAVCISQYVAREVRRYVSPSLPLKIVYNIVDLERFQPRQSSPSDMAKLPDELWFGTIGPITPLKGHDIFLDAAEKVLTDLPNASFVIAGSNPYATQANSGYEAQLRRKVESSALRERVKFLGFRNDVPNVLSQLDVLVQPNRGPEGLGRSVMEAMACGVPVIAVNKWGPAELIQDGRTGVLFPPLDSNALAAHMLTLGKDAAFRQKLGRNAEEWMQHNLAPQDLANRFQTILSGLISTQRNEVLSA